MLEAVQGLLHAKFDEEVPKELVAVLLVGSADLTKLIVWILLRVSDLKFVLCLLDELFEVYKVILNSLLVVSFRERLLSDF